MNSGDSSAHPKILNVKHHEKRLKSEGGKRCTDDCQGIPDTISFGAISATTCLARKIDGLYRHRKTPWLTRTQRCSIEATSLGIAITTAFGRASTATASTWALQRINRKLGMVSAPGDAQSSAQLPSGPHSSHCTTLSDSSL